MKILTPKEEEIMNIFWKGGPMFVKELLKFYINPKPNFNTISTIIRILGEKDMSKGYNSIYFQERWL